MEATDELRSRMTSVLEIVEHEGRAISALEDPRVDGVLRAMNQLRAEIVAALAELGSPSGNGRGSAP